VQYPVMYYGDWVAEQVVIACKPLISPYHLNNLWIIIIFSKVTKIPQHDIVGYSLADQGFC